MRFKLKPALLARGERLLVATILPALCKQKFEAQLARSEFVRAFLPLLRTNALDDYGPAYAGAARMRTSPHYPSQTRVSNSSPNITWKYKVRAMAQMLALSSGVAELLVEFLKTPR